MFKHGLYKTPEFKIYKGMLKRVRSNHPSLFPYYKAKNIKVCDRWLDPKLGFLNFLEDMGKMPEGYSIERRDGNKDYRPGNCYWATDLQQVLNTSKRKSSTGIRGVSIDKRDNTFEAKIKINKKYVYLGRFKDKELAREKFLQAYHNQYGKFPPEYKPIPIPSSLTGKIISKAIPAMTEAQIRKVMKGYKVGEALKEIK